MHPGIETWGRFRVDTVALADDAAERCLDVRPGASKPVIKVEMAKGGVHIVPPHQTDHPPAEPDAFRVAGRAGHQTGRLGELVDLALGVLGRICRLGGRRLVGALGVAALGDGSANAHKQGQGRNGDALKNCNSKPGTNPTHEIPD